MKLLFLTMAGICLLAGLGSCKRNPCDQRICLHGNAVAQGSICNCNCAAGFQGSECNHDYAYYFLGGDVLVSEHWKIAGTSNSYITSINESYTPSSVFVYEIFLADNQYRNQDSATAINPTTLQLNALPVQLITGGTITNYTYTGQGIRAGDSTVVNGALMQGSAFVDSIRLVYEF